MLGGAPSGTSSRGWGCMRVWARRGAPGRGGGQQQLRAAAGVASGAVAAGGRAAARRVGMQAWFGRTAGGGGGAAAAGSEAVDGADTATAQERITRLRDACEAAFSTSYASAAAVVGDGSKRAKAMAAVAAELDRVKVEDVGLGPSEHRASSPTEVLMGVVRKLGGSAIGGKDGVDERQAKYEAARQDMLPAPPLPGEPGVPGNAASGRAPPITYLNVFECAAFSVGIFVLPARARLPLHNHPDMLVLSKLLFGSMHVRSYDWEEPPPEGAPHYAAPAATGGRLARIRENGVITAPVEPQVALPSEGNLHAITALTPCAMLDVIAPPYNTRVAGRDCTYYRESPVEDSGATPGTADGRGMRVRLTEYEPADDFVVRGGYYTGAKPT